MLKEILVDNNTYHFYRTYDTSSFRCWQYRLPFFKRLFKSNSNSYWYWAVPLDTPCDLDLNGEYIPYINFSADYQ